MKTCFFAILFLGFALPAFAETPSDDLDQIPNLSEADKALMRETRADAKANLEKYNLGYLVGASQSLSNCLSECVTAATEKHCVEKCAMMGETTGLNEAAINHNPGDVNCTGNHAH